MTAIQTVYLNQTEYRVPPVIHAVQNDTGRKVKMVISDQVLPSGSTATLDFMRSDRSHYSVTCEAFVAADNSFTAEIDQALTQAGPTECQLKVSGIVSTFKFIIDVQPDVSGISVQQDGYSVEQIIEIMDSKGITEDIKQTLLACFEKVAWIDEDGQDCYNALYNALYPPKTLIAISCVYTQSGTVYAGDPLDELRSDLEVKAHFEGGTSEIVSDYYLTGTLAEGESTITVTYLGKITTFDVEVVTLVSLSAVYTQSGTVYDTDSLDVLKNDLVVTATYDDSSTLVITDYTLSGTLTTGTSTITVSYGGKTTSITVVVTHDDSADWDYIWKYEDGLPPASDWTWETSGGSGQIHEIVSDGMKLTAKSGTSAQYYMPYAPASILSAGGAIIECKFYIPVVQTNTFQDNVYFYINMSDETKLFGVKIAHPKNQNNANKIVLWDGANWYGSDSTLVRNFSQNESLTVRLEADFTNHVAKVYVNGVLTNDNVDFSSYAEGTRVRMGIGGGTIDSLGIGAIVQYFKVKYGLS